MKQDEKDPYEQGHLFSGYTDPSQQNWPVNEEPDIIALIIEKLRKMEEEKKKKKGQ